MITYPLQIDGSGDKLSNSIQLHSATAKIFISIVRKTRKILEIDFKSYAMAKFHSTAGV